jgi:hypothetical protein
MHDNIEIIIYCFIDSFCIENRYVMVTYYVTLFVSLLLNYLPHHIFFLGGIHVTTYVTPTTKHASCPILTLEIKQELIRQMLKKNNYHGIST